MTLRCPESFPTEAPSYSKVLRCWKIRPLQILICMKNISYATRLYMTKYGLTEMSIDSIFEFIKSGNLRLYDDGIGEYTLRDITIAIREQSDSDMQNAMKERFLPVVTFNGIWDGAQICRYSNITALDFDHINSKEEQDKTIRLLKSTSFVMAIFRTFKSWRIKAIVEHDNMDPAKHKEMYEQLIERFNIYGIDKSCKDLSRKNFLPWDEDIWINPVTMPYHFVPSQRTVHLSSASRYPSIGKPKSPQSIINILNSSWAKKHPEYWQAGNRANSIFRCACQMCEYGVPQDMAEDYFLTGGWIADDFTEAEVIKHVRGAYHCNQNTFGVKDFV